MDDIESFRYVQPALNISTNDLVLSLIHEEPDCGDELNVNLFIQEYDTFEAAYEVALIMRENDKLCYDPNL